MTHAFEVREEIDLDATPEQVWDAIATGPGVNSWFMGRNEIAGGVGSRTTIDVGGWVEHATITRWEPCAAFAYQSDTAENGTFMAFEFLIEGRDGGSTTLRFAHHGMLGDDWADEYDALRTGDSVYLRKLAAYVKFFAPRTSRYDMTVPGPRVPDKAAVWDALRRALGVDGPVADGEKARLSIEGVPAVDGVVDFTKAQSFLGMRTPDAMYVLIHGYEDTVLVTKHSFGDVDDQAAETRAWEKWLAATFG
jgi:uncharacterized protein YndB with AHSA1/START domain